MKLDKSAIFTVDLEDWNHALHQVKRGHNSVDSVNWLIYKLNQCKVKAIFYVLGRFSDEFPGMVDAIKAQGHVMGDHGYSHDHGESQQYPRINQYYRSPYWDSEPMPWPPSGGFFFRVMPYEYVKWAVKKSGVFWIHPHDLDEKHPKLKNPWLNWKRRVGLKSARRKLERLLSEVKWKDPKDYFYASAG